MVEEEFKDDFISEAVKMGARKLTSPDFEHQTMMKIREELLHKQEVHARLKTSFQFFIGALIMAIGLAFVAIFKEVFEQYNIQPLAIVGLFTVCVLGSLCYDNFKRLLGKYAT